MQEDLNDRGLEHCDLARLAHVSHSAVYRWFAGLYQTNSMCLKLSNALGYTPKRYRLARPGSAKSVAA